jgi:hypothetical protein
MVWIYFPLLFFLSNNLCGNAFNFEVNIYEIMTEEHISNSKKGLALGVKAPTMSTKDIYNKNVNSTDLLQTYNGILIDFFRGAW